MKKILQFILIAILTFGFSAEQVFGATNTLSATLDETSNQWFTAADSADLSRTGDFTIDAHIKINSVKAYNFLFDKINSGSGDQGYEVYFPNDNTMHLVTTQSTTGQDKSVSWTPSTATWYRIRWTYNATSKEGKFYAGTSCPATIVDTTTGHTDPTDGSGLLYLGSQLDSTTRDFDGKMDEVRVWAEVHTTDDQCTQLNGNESNLKAVWMFNGTAGTCAGTSLEDKGDTTDPAGAGADDLTNVGTAQCTNDVPFGAAAVAAILKRRRVNTLILE